jgi:hypothetical protein
MKKITPSLLFLFICTFVCMHSSYAQQSEKKIKAYIRGQLKKIDTGNGDMLVKENVKLMNYLAKVCAKDSATLHMKFAGLGDDFKVVSADDGKMRVYYWDTHIDKTVYFVLAQFQSESGIHLARWNDDSGKIESIGRGIFTPSRVASIKTADSSTVYLVISNVRIGQSTLLEKVEAYVIDDKRLMEKDFFKTGADTKNMISTNYDPTYESNYNVKSTLHLSKDKQKLYIPLVVNSVLKKNSLVYVFDGNNYVFDKNNK